MPVTNVFTDYDGNEIDYTMDGESNITSQTVHTRGYHPGEPSTYVTRYAFDSNNNKTSESDPNGNTQTWTYDDRNNMLTATKTIPGSYSVNSAEGSQVASVTTTYTYEPRFNQVASVVDPNGNTTTYCYGTATSNPGGNVLKIKYPATAAGAAEETFTYNSAGQVLTDTAPDGTVTKNVYDPATGYLTETIKDYSTSSGHLNATTQYTYDAVGNVTSVTDPNGNTTTNTYNALGLLVETDGPNGEVETRTYDQNKNLVDDIKSAPDSQTEKTENVYDTLERLVATRVYTDATDYLETDYTYDYAGNRLTVTDPLGHTVSTAYDERSKPYLFTDACGHTSQYDFDGNGNTIKLTDELSHVTTYAFDGLDKLEQKTFPDSSSQTWSYDANGNITSLRTTAGNTIAQTYDARNRMLTQVYPVTGGTSTISNVYDIMGRVSSTSEGGTSLSYAYDNMGRNTSFTDQAGLSSTYTYDLDGNRIQTAYPSGETVKRTYDASNRLTTLQQVGATATTTVATYSYNILNQLTNLSLANDTTAAYSYDLANRLTGVDNELSSSLVYSYVYDNASRVTQITEPRGTISSEYTKRNEVKEITEPSGSPFSDQSFAYDAGYNRSSWVDGSTTTDYTANNLNQYTAVGSASPTWNGDGGLATFAGNTYTYDSLGRLTQVSNSVGIYIFKYDPMGRRVMKVDENPGGEVLGTYQYHYDGSEVAVEYQPSTIWTYYLGPGIDQPVARDGQIHDTLPIETEGVHTEGAHGPPPPNPLASMQWYYRDGHGSVAAVADVGGNLLEAYEYDAQGHFQITDGDGDDITATGTAIGNELMYTGREYDVETGNYFYRARYYNPDLGRFISRDPLSGAEFSQGTNLYAYCENNYLNLTDPTGKSWGSVALNFAEGVVVGAAITAAVIVAAPEIAAAAAAVGVADAVITGTELAVGAAAGAYGLYNTGEAIGTGIQTGDWDNAAYDVGNIVGGAGVMEASGAMSDWSVGDDINKGYQPYFDPDASLGQNFVNWLGTDPDASADAAAAAAFGTGVGISDGPVLNHKSCGGQ